MLWLLAGFGPASAQDSAAVAESWGLLGTWSVDCAQAASKSNAHLSFVRVDGQLMHRRDFGELRDEYPIRSATAAADGSLEILVDLRPAGKARTIVFARAGEGKKRAIQNRGEQGDYTIRNGKFVANGAPTPVQTRCAILTN